MHSAHAHITNSNPPESIQSSFLGQDGVEIRQNLGGVFSPTVTTVDNRNAGPFGCFVRSTFHEMAHHNHVAVILEHFKGVLDGFHVKIARAGHFCIRKPGYFSAQAQHSGFVGQASSSGRLVKSRHQGFFFQQINVFSILRNGSQFFSNCEYSFKFVSFNVSQR